MSSANLFTITPDIINIGERAINALINQLGKQCKLIYESTNKTQCSNCFFDIANGRSTGVYNGTGPRPFTSGKCPVCRGTGYLPGTTTASEVIQLLINWQPKSQQILDELIALQGITDKKEAAPPAQMVSVKGFIADLPKIIQAKYIILDYANSTYQNSRFTLWGEPVREGNIIKNRYFGCFLKRIGD